LAPQTDHPYKLNYGEDSMYILGKYISNLSSIPHHNYENICFGSWEVGLENIVHNQPGDFILSLSRINILNPPPLIPLDGLGGSQGDLFPSPNLSENSPILYVEIDFHKDPQSSNVVNYNLMPRTKGTHIFFLGVAGGLGILEGKYSKPS